MIFPQRTKRCLSCDMWYEVHIAAPFWIKVSEFCTLQKRSTMPKPISEIYPIACFHPYFVVYTTFSSFLVHFHVVAIMSGSWTIGFPLAGSLVFQAISDGKAQWSWRSLRFRDRWVGLKMVRIPLDSGRHSQLMNAGKMVRLWMKAVSGLVFWRFLQIAIHEATGRFEGEGGIAWLHRLF